MTKKTPQDEGHLGRRTLAAIMFTDVVGFSRRTGEDEDRTLRMTARDLKIIGEFVKQHEGRVIKSTGDGCLAFFASGVQAVSCAQEIQHHFAELAQTLPSRDLLQHRIGIHLGDVYLKGNDVMGDGVNVAARLEAEAPPGGICISQALYEIARSRLRLHTVHLGPKQLKNIAESVQVYQVLVDEEPPEAVGTARRLVGFLGTHWLLNVAALAAIILVALGTVHMLGEEEQEATDNGTATPSPTPPDDTDTTPDTTLDTTPPVPLDAMAKAALPEVPRMKKMHLETRDYKAFADWIEQNHLHQRGSPVHDDFAKCRKLEELFAWAESALGGYNKGTPLEVSSPTVGKMMVWSDPNGQLMLKTADGTQRTSLRRSPEAGYVLLVLASLARDQWKDRAPASTGADRRIMDALYLFAEENKLDAEGLLSWLKSADDDAELPDRRLSAAEVFRLFDKDKDGKLTLEETPRLLRRRFTLLDTNRDGLLSLDELRGSRPRRPRRRP